MGAWGESGSVPEGHSSCSSRIPTPVPPIQSSKSSCLSSDQDSSRDRSMYRTFRSISSSRDGNLFHLQNAMGAKIHAGPAVNAFDGHFSLPRVMAPTRQAFCAFSAACAEILVKDHPAVRPSSPGPVGAGSGTGRVLAAATDHDPEVALYPALGLDLDGAVLQGDRAGASPAAGEHASQAAYAALGMGHLQAAALFGLLCAATGLSSTCSSRGWFLQPPVLRPGLQTSINQLSLRSLSPQY